MVEKDMQNFFKGYLEDNPPIDPEVYELKICKNKSLPFSRVPAHQEEALLKAEEEGLYHKITDLPFIPGSKIRFQKKKPFDCLFLNNVRAYVVIWFYTPRTKKVFYKVRIKDYLQMKREADRKSMTEEMVRECGTPLFIT